MLIHKHDTKTVAVHRYADSLLTVLAKEAGMSKLDYATGMVMMHTAFCCLLDERPTELMTRLVNAFEAYCDDRIIPSEDTTYFSMLAAFLMEADK